MSPERLIPLCLLSIGLTTALGCGPSTEYYAPAPDPYYERVLQGGRVEPRTDAERALLAACSEAPLGEPVIAPDGSGSASVAYAAASGLVCRNVEMGSPSAGAGQNLVCGDGVEWFFVPDVHGEGSTASSAP